MDKVISGKALRERLLGRLASAPHPSTDAWVQALAARGNRDLLALIASQRPQSISELSDLAGRAQPNVSRSLTALINAGLVEVRLEGRASIPTLTEFGRDKVSELGLAEKPAEISAASSVLAEEGDLPFLSAAIAKDRPEEQDSVNGDLVATMTLSGHDEHIVAMLTGDLNAIALGIVDNWWRILYRRDAPFKLGEFTLKGGSSSRQISIALKSQGNHIERLVRSVDEPRLILEGSTRLISLHRFEQNLLNDVVRPVVAHIRSFGRFDRPLESKLCRLEDTYTYANELTFARTVGALGNSPYTLKDEWPERVRRLVAAMPDEDARLDFASAVLTDDFDAAASWTSSELSKQGKRNSLPELRILAGEIPQLPMRGLRPWQRGTNTAQNLRKHLKWGPEKRIGDVTALAALFGADTFQASPTAPGQLRAFQSEVNGVPTIVVEEECEASTKFLLARAIGDFLVYRTSPSCVADLYTDRQAIGRAFAAELIAPAEGVVRLIEDEDLSISRVAQHYGATDDVIHHQYRNNYKRLVEA
jgi:DNA-binding transcriptional ArsR family regulator